MGLLELYDTLLDKEVVAEQSTEVCGGYLILFLLHSSPPPPSHTHTRLPTLVMAVNQQQDVPRPPVQPISLRILFVSSRMHHTQCACNTDSTVRIIVSTWSIDVLFCISSFMTHAHVLLYFYYCY